MCRLFFVAHVCRAFWNKPEGEEKAKLKKKYAVHSFSIGLFFEEGKSDLRNNQICWKIFELLKTISKNPMKRRQIYVSLFFLV